MNRFSAPGEALFEVRRDDGLVGVGGLNVDPFNPSGRIGRVRRMYVLPAVRGAGVGRTLLRAIERAAGGHFTELHLYTGTTASARFNERFRYSKFDSTQKRVSHRKRL